MKLAITAVMALALNSHFEQRLLERNSFNFETTIYLKSWAGAKPETVIETIE